MDWDHHFRTRPELGNSAPVEAVIKVVAYWLRSQPVANSRFLEVGCGLGRNLEWLAGRGIEARGVDISPTAVALAQKAGCRVTEGTATRLPFKDAEFDGVIEACVLQHLRRDDRIAAYREVARVLRPGGLFVGYSVSTRHTVFQAQASRQSLDDPSTIDLVDEHNAGLLPGIGLTHFFAGEAEFQGLLPNFTIECLPVMFRLPADEARRRNFTSSYEDHFVVCRAVKR